MQTMVECVTLILVTRQDYIIHCIISIIPNVGVSHIILLIIQTMKMSNLISMQDM